MRMVTVYCVLPRNFGLRSWYFWSHAPVGRRNAANLRRLCWLLRSRHCTDNLASGFVSSMFFCFIKLNLRFESSRRRKPLFLSRSGNSNTLKNHLAWFLHCLCRSRVYFGLIKWRIVDLSRTVANVFWLCFFSRRSGLLLVCSKGKNENVRCATQRTMFSRFAFSV